MQLFDEIKEEKIKRSNQIFLQLNFFKMKHQISTRKLSNGGLFIFDNEKKDIYLIGNTNVKEWENSDKDWESVQSLVKVGKIRHLDKKTLKRISEALSFVALLG